MLCRCEGKSLHLQYPLKCGLSRTVLADWTPTAMHIQTNTQFIITIILICKCSDPSAVGWQMLVNHSPNETGGG